ncbi:hypothetical protein HPP92_023497 [Vanilla planifolia]|uniref:PX domain-containing protein n=1 Tax=Vanilla planifolia TaxID=51239 RepID=A0A835UAG6_VANPL|nr:hypothetical protein HPP92_023497 [Vanilla planifolia]
MPKTSPPKHRHDGTSPLPLSMDWSPPPKKWEGRNTVWPHDPKTGWSYCVMIPSWVVQARSGASNDNLLNPLVLYRVQVGMQSPQGVTSSHGILRRFNDFLKLFSALKRVFPKKGIPPAPPKHALLRINSSRQLLEERRRALEEWMGKILSDIELSRSAPVAAFLELEVAARSFFQDATPETSTVGDASGMTSLTVVLAGQSSSGASAECSTEASKSQSVTSDATNEIAGVTYDDGVGASFTTPKDILIRNRISSSDLDLDKLSGHSRKLSCESIGSDVSSIRGSELSNQGLLWDGPVDFSGGIEFPVSMEALRSTKTQTASEEHIILPIDEQLKLNRVLVTMQRRLVAARTDMEDLIARLNQEIVVKEYLTTRVKDLEAELEVTKQKSKENLQQAILLERERFTQAQWEIDELRRKYLELESKIKLEQSEQTIVNSEITSGSNDKKLEQALAAKQDQIDNLQRHLEELQKKSKADVKVLVKEVKLLRKSQVELKERLNHSTKHKAEFENVLQNEEKFAAHAKSVRKIVNQCEILRQCLRECSVNFLSEVENKFTVTLSSFPGALDLLATSDNRIDDLMAELLAQNDETAISDLGRSHEPTGQAIAMNGDGSAAGMAELRRLLMGTLLDNAMLRKQLNSVFRCALQTASSSVNAGDEEAGKMAQSSFQER